MSQPQDDLNRSWLRRGWANPTPTWGETVPPAWRETGIKFMRHPHALNSYGQFDGMSPVVVWDTTAHCEIIEVRMQQLGKDNVWGVLFQRAWSIYTGYPDS